MDLNAQYRFAAPPQRVWDVLMDPNAIASCLPGCQTFEPHGTDTYRVVLTAGIAAVSGTFNATVTIADRMPPASYRLIVQGQGGPGFVLGEAAVTLVPEGDGVTVHVVGSAQIGGLVAQVGQRLLGATARMMMERFFGCLQQKVAT